MQGVKKQTVNSFSNGLNSDHTEYSTPSNVYTDAKNLRFITYNGQEFILQSDKGNRQQSILNPGFSPVAVKVFDNIAYIVSTNEAGQTELGTFPSPLQPGQDFSFSESLPEVEINRLTGDNFYDFVFTGNFEIGKSYQFRVNKSGGLSGNAGSLDRNVYYNINQGESLGSFLGFPSSGITEINFTATTTDPIIIRFTLGLSIYYQSYTVSLYEGENVVEITPRMTVNYANSSPVVQEGVTNLEGGITQTINISYDSKSGSSSVVPFSPVLQIRLNGVTLFTDTLNYNDVGDADSFEFTPTITGDYEIRLNVNESLPFKPFFSSLITYTLAGDQFSGPVELSYKSLKNLDSDDFRTTVFNFEHKKHVELEVQPSYDGTVNMIMSQVGKTPRLVNTRIAFTNGETFEIIDRVGTGDTNLYSSSDVETKTRLVETSSVIPTLEFLGTSSGGQLEFGNYHFYFTYSTEDGSTSQIIEESRTVSVFSGDTLESVTGGLAGKRSNRKISFSLSNLDLSFDSIKVYYTINTADVVEPIAVAYELVSPFEISSDTLNLNITGFEPVIVYSLDNLSLQNASIQSYATMCQIKNRLVVANVVQSGYDRLNLFDYSKSITIAEEEDELEIQNLLPSSAGYTTIISLNQQVVSDSLGYLNPKNIYNKLGYWRGETYRFGIVFILKDGTSTDVFPLFGTDNMSGLLDYTGTIDETTDYFDSVTGANFKGVYRFEDRGDLFETDGNGFTYASINGVKFTLPTVPQEVKDVTIGCYFVRAERNKNALFQGVLTPTVKTFLVSPLFAEVDGTYTYGSAATNADWTDYFDKKVLPCPLGLIETYEGNNAKNTRMFYFKGANLGAPTDSSAISSKKFAIYTPDAFQNSSYANTNYNNIKSTIYFDNKVNSVLSNHRSFDGSTFFYPSLIATKSLSATALNSRTCSIYSVQGHLDQFNVGNFSSSWGTVKDNLYARQNTGSNLIIGNHNKYIGVDLDSLLFFSDVNDILYSTDLHNPLADNPLAQVNRAQNNVYADDKPIGYLVTCYGESGKNTTEQVKSIHSNLSGITYTPISKRYSWEEIESLEVAGFTEVVEYGGDCFIGAFGYNIYGGLKPIETADVYGATPGLTATFITQSNWNAHLRTEQEFDLEETALYGNLRTFFPYLMRSSSSGTEDTNFLRSNLTRIPTTDSFNRGYNKVTSERYNVYSNPLIPFTRTNFPNRIWYSNVYVNSAFTNGYRIFSGLNYQDYPSEMGVITGIRNLNDTLYIVFTNGVIVTQVNERTAIADSGGGQVFIRTDNFLTENFVAINKQIGTSDITSLEVSRNALYGMDRNEDKVWQVSGSQMTILSDFKVSSLINGYFKFAKELRTFYNVHTNDVIFSFIGDVSTSILYNESLQMWVSRLDYIPVKAFNISETFYSMDHVVQEGIWAHDSGYCKYYGTQYNFELEIVISEDIGFQKIFNNIKLISNEAFPETIVYTNENETQKTQIISDIKTVGRLYGNSHYKENHLYVQVQKDPLENAFKGRSRDKFIRIRFIYNGNIESWKEGVDRVIKILAIQTDYAISFS